jgi:FlaA1/EpsC-like NDP-sugar epimerase
MERFYLLYCLPQKNELNRRYAENATLVQDIWIILQTLIPYWLGVLGMYTLCLVFSFWLSYQLKSDFQIAPAEYTQFKSFVPIIVLPQLIFLVWRGQLRGLLSYFSIPEMRKTIGALALGLLVQIVLCYLIYGRLGPGRSILLMDFILSFFTLCAVRMALRMSRESFSRAHSADRSSPRRVALIGTGELATNLVLDFHRSESPARRVIAFFDDNPRTWNKRPHNIPVVGMPECLLKKEWFEQIDEVIVTLPKEQSARIREIGKMLQHLPVKVSVVSGWPLIDAS